MNSFNRKIAFFAIVTIVFNGLQVYGSDKIKKEYEDLYPLSDITNEIADRDLEAGLHSLSSAELKTLSEFIDEESKTSDNSAFLSAFENYWRGSSNLKSEKKKRTIDDLYDELAHENAEVDMRSESQNNPSNIPTNDGKCHCEKPSEKDDTIRTKRDSLRVNIQEPNIDDYVRELEESFPRDQGVQSHNADNIIKSEHIRIKRL